MTEKDKQVEFKVGDRVASLDTNEEGTVSRLCSGKGAIYVRWDKDSSQGMVEISTLRKE